MPYEDDARLTELYGLHSRGELPSDDERWNEVTGLIRRFVVREVRKRNRVLFGSPLEQRVEDVYTSVLCKFVALRLDHQGNTIIPLLRRTVANDTAQSFRQGKSPATVCFDGAEQTWEGEQTVPQDRPSMFAMVCGRLPRPFRWREHEYAREWLLAGLLTSGDMPPPSSLAIISVPVSVRTVVHAAAAYDINTAIQEVLAGSAIDAH